MITLELDDYGVIVAAGGIVSDYERAVKHYQEEGCPSFLKGPVRERLEMVETTHAAMIAALRVKGYLMKDDDLKVVDLDALMAVPYKKRDF